MLKGNDEMRYYLQLAAGAVAGKECRKLAPDSMSRAEWDRVLG